MCLIALTAKAMEQLLGLCEDYGAANDIALNPLKSVCLVFKLCKYKLLWTIRSNSWDCWNSKLYLLIFSLQHNM